MYWTHSGYTESTPTTEPVRVDELQEFGRIDDDAAGEVLEAFIVAARQQVEAMLNRALINRTVVAYFDDWPENVNGEQPYMYLPVAPVGTVLSVKYYDDDNTLQTLDSAEYNVDTVGEPGRVRLASGATWPTIKDRTNAIEITYTAGYGTAATDVPQAIRIAIMAAALDVFEHRDMNIEARINENPAVRNLLAAYKIYAVL